MDRFLNLIESLNNIRFNLNYDYKSLNKWNTDSLILSGFKTIADSIEQDENALEVNFWVFIKDHLFNKSKFSFFLACFTSNRCIEIIER